MIRTFWLSLGLLLWLPTNALSGGDKKASSFEASVILTNEDLKLNELTVKINGQVQEISIKPDGSFIIPITHEHIIQIEFLDSNKQALNIPYKVHTRSDNGITFFL